MKESAHVAYDAWKEHCNLPEWSELPDNVKDAWRAVLDTTDAFADTHSCRTSLPR